ncbi:MAG: hypothetical protein HY731_15405 [Candidatus Tectomicrobia bacterium]|nr:hypothetical protein [Candidatus Tectomicrobia bacterium]
MLKEVELLLKIQALDFKAQELREAKEKIPKEIEAARQVLSTLQKSLEMDQEEVEKFERERRGSERAVEFERNNLKARQSRLSEVKTNKEYDSVRTEIRTLEQKIVQLEDGVLALMEAIEEKHREIQHTQRAITEKKQAFLIEEEEKQREVAQFEQLLEEALHEREQLTVLLEAPLIETYKRLSSTRRGFVVVELVAEICQGCHMKIPPQVASETRRNDRLMTCPHCNRFIFWRG